MDVSLHGEVGLIRFEEVLFTSSVGGFRAAVAMNCFSGSFGGAAFVNCLFDDFSDVSLVSNVVAFYESSSLSVLRLAAMTDEVHVLHCKFQLCVEACFSLVVTLFEFRKRN
jgi:hypothetical protein